MESFSFAVKTILFTVILIWVCQFRINDKTVERQFLDFVRSSPVTEPIHKIAFGSRKLANDGWAEFRHLIGSDKGAKPETTSTRSASTFHWTWGESRTTSNSTTTEDIDRDSKESE